MLLVSRVSDASPSPSYVGCLFMLLAFIISAEVEVDRMMEKIESSSADEPTYF